MEATSAAARRHPRAGTGTGTDTPPDSQSSSCTDLCRRSRSLSRPRAPPSRAAAATAALPPATTDTDTAIAIAAIAASPPPIPQKHPRPQKKKPPRRAELDPRPLHMALNTTRPPPPSEHESRQFTKANTLQVQKRLAEVDAARTQMQLHRPPPPLGFSEPRTVSARDSYTSLDGILSSYESSDEGAQQKQKQKQLEWPAASRLPTPPAQEWHGWHVAVARAAGPAARRIDVEIAFSSLGGFGSGGIWRKIAALVS